MLNESRIFGEALNLHLEGQLDAAAKLYKKIIKQTPDHFDALHHLGMVEQAQAKFERAEELFRRCLLLDPRFQPVYNSIANVLIDLGRFHEALNYADQSVKLMPNNHNAHFLRARALAGIGTRQDALLAYQRALFFNPKSIQCLNNIANLHRASGNTELALKSFGQALAIDPNFHPALANRAALHHELGHLTAAVKDLEAALRIETQRAPYWSSLASIYGAMLHYDEALTAAKTALNLAPRSKEVRYTLAKALIDLGQPDEASSILEAILCEEPKDSMVLLAYGVSQKDIRHFGAAHDAFERASADIVRSNDAVYNSACLTLLQGNLLEGFKRYEARKLQSEPVGNRNYDVSEWSGVEDVSGKTILIHAEQGIGDTFQFCRYIPLVKARGATVLFAEVPKLETLLSTLDCEFEFVDPDKPAKPFDFHIPLLSLPRAFGTDLNTIPSRVPYLSAVPERIQYWQTRLTGDGLKVGICWQGSRSKIDQGRSIRLESFKSLSAKQGVRLISLQKGYGEEQLSNLADNINIEQLGPDFDEGPDAFLDAAAVMSVCDLIITSDTAIAHLAGALGRPTWVALKYIPDWRWMLERTDSPWYPTMRLFRQKQPGDWASVFHEIELALLALLDAGKNTRWS